MQDWLERIAKPGTPIFPRDKPSIMVMTEAEFLNGPKGKTLFYKPFPLLPEIGDWNTQVPQFFQRVEKSGDDRSYAILSAMIVEHHVDRVLRLILPGFDKLVQGREFTFWMKVNLLKSFALIPEHLLDCADAINSVRNEFAHNLTVESFDGMRESPKDKLKWAYGTVPGGGVVQSTLKRLLGVTLQIVVIGMRLYEGNVRLLVETIRSEGFHGQLQGEFNKRNQEILQAIKAEPQATERTK